MRRREDDLVAWRDDPVVRALLAPASDDELAGADEIMTAFRTAHASPRRRPGARHVGAGVTTVVVALALSGGVAAAAFTHTLPAPVQSAMHAVFGDVGVPPAHPSVSPAHHVAQHHRRPGSTGHAAAAALPGGHVTPPVAPRPQSQPGATAGLTAPPTAVAPAVTPTPTTADSPAA